MSIWSDIPRGVVHHHFWSPLNGALFTAKDILGNVRIAGNHIIDAYNGIRVRLSDAALRARAAGSGPMRASRSSAIRSKR